MHAEDNLPASHAMPCRDREGHKPFRTRYSSVSMSSLCSDSKLMSLSIDLGLLIFRRGFNGEWYYLRANLSQPWGTKLYRMDDGIPELLSLQ